MPERSSYAPGTPCWVDLNTSDPAAAREFYGALFGWQFEIDPGEQTMHYTTVTSGGRSVAGMTGVPVTERAPTWNTYFATDDIERLAGLVSDNGGTTVLGPHPVGPAGSIVMWQDPTGAFAGAWQPGEHHGAAIVNEPGAMIWNELATRDIDTAASFYSTILPVTVQDMSEGSFHYRLLKVGDRQVGGIWQMTGDVAPDVHPHWSVYFAVAETDAAVEAATGLGGSVAVPAKDSPYGRLAGLRDPQGASFYVITASERG